MQTLACLDRGRDSGAYRLWVTVTLNAVETLKASGDRDKLAWSFLSDDNPFVVGVCNVLDIDIETFREQLSELTGVILLNKDKRTIFSYLFCRLSTHKLQPLLALVLSDRRC